MSKKKRKKATSFADKTWINDLFYEVLAGVKTDQSFSELEMKPDNDPARIERRIKALRNTIGEIKKKIHPLITHVYNEHSLEQVFVMLNALSYPAYDQRIVQRGSLLGAAIWMLDQIRDNGKLPELTSLLPKEKEVLDKVTMPTIYDLSYSEETIKGMLHLLQYRNSDCTGPSEEGPSGYVRCYMDLYTTMNRHKQDVPSRQRFEAAMAFIPQKAKEQAAESYKKKAWEIIELYYKCQNIYLAQGYKLHNERSAFEERKKQKIGEIQGQLEKTMSDSDWKFVQQTEPLIIKNFNEIIAEQERLVETELDLDEQSTNLPYYILSITMPPHEVIMQKLGAEAAEFWKEFEIENPYEICFGFLYLLENNSDLPWLYFPGIALMTNATIALPWNFTGPHLEMLTLQHNSEEKHIAGDFKSVPTPKRTKGIESQNWYRFVYEDKDSFDSAYRIRYNLAQIICDITGYIMPRNPERYQSALLQLERYGITDEKTLHTLLYCIALLGDGRFQSQCYHCNSESSDETRMCEAPDNGSSPEELKAQIATLQSEIKQLRADIYEAEKGCRDEKKQNKELEQQIARDRLELADLRELVFNQQENLYLDESPAKDITFPYKTKRRIVVFGGHDSWAKEIKPRLPDVRFIDRNTLPNADIIRNADVVWIQSNAFSHAFFYRVIEEVRRYNIPLRFFTFASAIKCAEQIVREDMDSQ